MQKTERSLKKNGERNPGINGREIISFLDKITPGFRIADLGCGPNGAIWWNDLPPHCTVDAYDLYNIPEKLRDNIRFYHKDVTKLTKEAQLKKCYDLVVADHVFEHVIDPEALAASIAFILKNHGYLHVGIPDATNFTDRFYRLIHRDSGGHVSQFSRESFIDLMNRFGFKLIEVQAWPDDWVWLEKLFSLKYYGIEYFTQEELQYIVNVFRKELTQDKGYIYGWEFLFRKVLSIPLESFINSHIQQAERKKTFSFYCRLRNNFPLLKYPHKFLQTWRREGFKIALEKTKSKLKRETT